MTGYGLSTVTGPAVEPVGLDRAKQHCKVEHGEDDDLFRLWVAAARRLTETACGRRWITQTVRLTLPAFPAACDDPADEYLGWVRLPVRPVTAVSAVRYYATTGTLTTLDGSAYQAWLDHAPPIVGPAPATWWPATQPGRVPAVQVEFTAGYGASPAAVPEDAAHAILLCLGYWNAHRGDAKDPHVLPDSLGIPPAATRLLAGLAAGGYR